MIRMAVQQAQKLNTDYLMPTIGLGTWQSLKNEVEQAVKMAIRGGYRHIDTAMNYMNEGEIGDAMEELITAGEIKREDVFITTKVGSAMMHPTHVRREVELSLKKLKTDYVDLLLLHLPMSVTDERLSVEPRDRSCLFPCYSNGEVKFSFVSPYDTYKEMEKCQRDGLVRSIGLSNFALKSFQQFYEKVDIKPANLQNECHAWLQQDELIDYCNEKGVTFSAYAPMGSPGKQFAPGQRVILLEDPVVLQLAQSYNKTPAQILLRFLLQRGLIILPKSVKEQRLKQNFDVMSFEIGDEDMKKLRAMNKNLRLFKMLFDAPAETMKVHPWFPWPEEL